MSLENKTIGGVWIKLYFLLFFFLSLRGNVMLSNQYINLVLMSSLSFLGLVALDG